MKDNNQEVKKSSNAAANQVVQKKSTAKSLSSAPVKQLKENNTGLPDNLKSGVENLSGHSMDDVKVHYNSAQPAQLNAHAYAQGSEIHVAPGQDQHLPHEAWHVAQQKQGRVQPTMQMKNQHVNDDSGLEKEADVMGLKAASQINVSSTDTIQTKSISNTTAPIQMMSDNDKKKVEKVKPGSFDQFLAWAKGKAESAKPATDIAAPAAGIGAQSGNLHKAFSTDKAMSNFTFEGSSAAAAKSTMGMGEGSSGVLGSIGSVGGLAAGVVGGGLQAYGAYGDQSKGKYDSKKGGKGLGGMATGAGRGLATAGDITNSSLKTTQVLAAVTGNAAAFSSAAAGLGPIAMITSGFQGIKGIHNAVLNKGREAKAEDLAKNADDDKQKELFQALAQNKKEKKHKGMADAALGAGGMIAAGLMLNPVTAPAGLAIGAALGLAQGAFSLFKGIRQAGRDKAAASDKKAAMTPAQIIEAKTKEYEATIAEGKEGNWWKRRKAAQAQEKMDRMNADKEKFAEEKSNSYKASSEKYNKYFNKNESTDSQKERKDEMAKQIQGLNPELQQETMQGVLGINKYEKGEDGKIALGADGKPKKNVYFGNQIFAIQEAFVKKQDPAIVAKTSEDIANSKRTAKIEKDSAGEDDDPISGVKHLFTEEQDVFTSERELTQLVAEALGMSEETAEKDLISSKL